MRNILLLAVAVICIFAGCKKKDSGSSRGSMSATINGEPFKINSCYIESFAGDTMSGLAFTGTNPERTGRMISLAIANYTIGTTGTYTITTYPDISIRASVDTNHTGQMAQSGTITINSSTEKAVSGTFSFTCYYGYIVTNGVFEAKW